MRPHAQVFKHLSERQLPTATCPTGILKVQINGWCVGSDVQHGLTKPGFMIFIRDDVAAGAKKTLASAPAIGASPSSEVASLPSIQV